MAVRPAFFFRPFARCRWGSSDALHGRFNLTLGAIATAVGIGAALSQVIAESIVDHVGFRAGFLFLAAVALAAFAILYLFMLETCNLRLEDA